MGQLQSSGKEQWSHASKSLCSLRADGDLKMPGARNRSTLWTTEQHQKCGQWCFSDHPDISFYCFSIWCQIGGDIIILILHVSMYIDLSYSQCQLWMNIQKSYEKQRYGLQVNTPAACPRTSTFNERKNGLQLGGQKKREKGSVCFYARNKTQCHLLQETWKKLMPDPKL